MLQLKRIFLSVIMAISCLAFIAPTQAEMIEPATIMIIDINYVISNAKAVDSVRQKLGTVKDKYSSTISKKESDLKSLQQELAKQKSTLSKAAFEKKRRDFENKVTAFRNKTQEKKQKLDNAMNEVLAKVQEKLLVIISKTAEKYGANLVIRKDFAIFAKADMDKTKEILEQLNKEIPSVKVAIPN